MRHQNIGIISNTFPPDQLGGAAVIAQQQAKDLTEQGRDVFVYTLAGPGCAAGKVSQEGYTITKLRSYNVARFGALGTLAPWHRTLWHIVDQCNILLALRITRMLKKQMIRQVITHNTMGLSGLLPLFLSIAKIEHTHMVHDVQLVEPSGILPWNHTKDTVLQKLYALSRRILFAGVSEVLYPSQYIKSFYEQRHFFSRAKTRVEAIDITTRLPVVSSKPHKDIQFLYVGELSEHKGVKMLISLWPRVAKEHKQARLDIVGSGVLAPYAKALAKGNPQAMYYGKQEGAGLAARYAAADVVLFTSQCIENRPNVVVEAMQAGCVIIATKTGGVPELLEYYERAYTVEPGSEEALVRAIAWAIHQHEERTHTPKSDRQW